MAKRPLLLHKVDRFDISRGITFPQEYYRSAVPNIVVLLYVSGKLRSIIRGDTQRGGPGVTAVASETLNPPRKYAPHFKTHPITIK